MTRFGMHTLVERHVERASHTLPSLADKRVSPHTIRPTTATHLLRAGVDLNTIRAWLGHVSLRTTNVYAEVDLEMKAKALAHCEIASSEPHDKRWRDDKGLMAFLRSLETLRLCGVDTVLRPIFVYDKVSAPHNCERHIHYRTLPLSDFNIDI